MKINFEESNPINIEKGKNKNIKKELDNLKSKNFYLMIIILLLILIIILLLLMHFFGKKNQNSTESEKSINEPQVKDLPLNLDKKENEIIPEDIKYNNPKYSYDYPVKDILYQEKNRPYLELINKKRTFEQRLPLSNDITCQPHLTEYELGAFLSLLTTETTYFETGSGCSSIIAKKYAKKSYAVEGCKKWYDKGVENGLKDNLIFRDLKPDNPDWSYPGSSSTLEDWKNYFQAYDKSYKADVIMIDGRFKIATAMDIFDKIEEDTIVLIHEYPDRPEYFVIEKYYQFIYIWDRLAAFVKKKDVESIPLEVQKEYWNKFK